MTAAVLVRLSSSSLAGKAASDWAARIRADHPRLFFNRETWPAVGERALGVEWLWYEQFKSRVVKLESELASQENPAARDLVRLSSGHRTGVELPNVQ